MTQAEFDKLPLLVAEKEVTSITGFSHNTLRKMVDNRVLKLVRPAGIGQGKYQKKQIADLLGFKV